MIFSLILILSISGVSTNSELALETIDPDEVSVYVSYLASDTLTGRNAGTEGNERAAQWIAEGFHRIGLEPGGDGGTYLQHFTFYPRGSELDEAVTANVVGIYRGTDPVLSKQAIVVGAHFDHVGMRGHPSNPGRAGLLYDDDRIWNGADDNASGTAAVIEIAQAFALPRCRVKRSIVFILFSAEEHGLCGSEHYVEHPFFPLQDTMAMVNLDMVGRNPKQPVYLQGADSSAEDYFSALALKCAERIPEIHLEVGGNWFRGGSDHYPFIKKNIPAVFFFSGLHADYHTVADEAHKIDCCRIALVAKTAFLMIHEMANDAKRVKFNPLYLPGFKGTAPSKLLGIRTGKRVDPEPLLKLGYTEEQGAVRVDKVHEDTPGHDSGLEEGDLILRIGTGVIRAQEPITSLREALDEAPTGVEVSLEIIRSGEVKVLTIRWPGEEAP